MEEGCDKKCLSMVQVFIQEKLIKETKRRGLYTGVGDIIWSIRVLVYSHVVRVIMNL